MMAAASRMIPMLGRILSSILAGASPKSRCCVNSLALRLPTAESTWHVPTSWRYRSSLTARPLPHDGVSDGQVRREFKYSIRGMSSLAKSQADIIERVKHDHQELEEYYANYTQAHKRGDEDEAHRWFNQFVREISRHAVSEELVLYPLLESQGKRGAELANQSRTDHQQTKNILQELQRTTDPDAFERRMDKMMAELRDHIHKEESEDLVYLKEHSTDKGRENAGRMFALGKKLAPTRPHAGVPNKPAALEAALGLLLTPIDKLRDVFTEYPNRN